MSHLPRIILIYEIMCYSTVEGTGKVHNYTPTDQRIVQVCSCAGVLALLPLACCDMYLALGSLV